MQIIRVVHDCELQDGEVSPSSKIGSIDPREITKNYKEILEAAKGIKLLADVKRAEANGQLGPTLDWKYKAKIVGQAALTGAAIGLAGYCSEKYGVSPPNIRPRSTDRMDTYWSERQAQELEDLQFFIVAQAVTRTLGYVEQNSDEIQYVSLTNAKKRFGRTPNLAVGSYTLHPRNPKMLTRLANFHRSLAMEKDDELVMLLGRMGAKTVEIIQASSNETNGAIEASAQTMMANRGDISAHFAAANDRLQHLIVEFEGKPTEIPEDLLSSSIWFSDDSKIQSIFQSRQFSENRILNYTLTNTYSDTFDFDFDLAARFLKIKGDLEADYHALSKQVRVFKVEFA